MDYSEYLFGDSEFDPRLRKKSTEKKEEFTYSDDPLCSGPAQDPLYFLGRIADFGSEGTKKEVYDELYNAFKKTGVPIDAKALDSIREIQCIILEQLVQNPGAYLDRQIFSDCPTLQKVFYDFFEDTIDLEQSSCPSDSSLLLFGASMYITHYVGKHYTTQ